MQGSQLNNVLSFECEKKEEKKTHSFSKKNEMQKKNKIKKYPKRKQRQQHFPLQFAVLLLSLLLYFKISQFLGIFFPFVCLIR